MDVITNERLIKRNARIGQISSLVGLLILGAGMYISFTQPELFAISLGALLIGFALSQVGIYFGNRWGRRPRPDELLNQSLKGLDGRYKLYHYQSPSSHLLVGPAGVWVILPRHQRGTITYEKGRWRQRGGNLYLKIFAQEGIGRPDLEINSELDSARQYLSKFFTEGEMPDINALMVFTNDRAEVQADDAPIPTMHVKKIKDFIRKTAKSKPISSDIVKSIQETLEPQEETSEE